MNVHIISLGFMNTKVIEASFEQLYKTRNYALPIASHVLIDQHYPIRRNEELPRLKEICDKYGVKILDPGKNLGLHDGFNWGCAQINLSAGDILIAYDPDSYPLGQGWDLALVRTILGTNREVVWASLMNPRSKGDLENKGYDKLRIDGYIDTWVARQAIVNSVCAWDWNWLKSVGGLREPLAYYGLLECSMWELIGNKKWAFLTGWEETDQLRYLHDQQYTEYKWAHAHLKSWPGDFESFLKAGCPLPDRVPDKLP